MTTTSPAGGTTAPPEDQAAAAGVPQRLVEAWAAHDAGAFADVFTEDGTMILPGLYCKGRDEIRSFMTTAFEGDYRGSRITGQSLDARFLGETTAVLITKGGVIGPGELEVAPERVIRASWVVVKQDGSWRLAAYQNSPAGAA